MTDSQTTTKTRKRVKALLLSDRIDTSNLEHDGVVSTAPLTYKFGAEGFVTLFRYGVAAVMGLTAAEEDEVLRGLQRRLIRPVKPAEEETVLIEMTPDKDDQIPPGGPIMLKTMTPDHLIVIADALSKSVVLARDEREVTAVFELVEPFARQLAERGRVVAGRRTILKHVGNALLVQHRVSGRVAVAEKPDVVWDRPDLDRLYARLEDEYELKERAEALARKLARYCRNRGSPHRHHRHQAVDAAGNHHCRPDRRRAPGCRLSGANTALIKGLDLRSAVIANDRRYCALHDRTASLMFHLISRDRGLHDFHDAGLQNR